MRVLVFGASSAQGYWDSQGGWADRLKHYYNALQLQDFSKEQPRVMNLGISGDSTKEVLKRIEPESRGRQNAKGLAIVVQVGSNNAAELRGQLHSTPEQYQTELKAIIKNAQAFTDKILVVGFPAVDETRTNPLINTQLHYKNINIAKLEETAAKCCQNLDVTFVPVHLQFKMQMDSSSELNAHDGLHPNDAGHELIFKLVQPELDKLLNT
jgi:lysophospholipase L1-like esterase